DLAGRYGARVRAGHAQAQAGTGERAVQDRLRLAHRAGAGAAYAGHVEGSPEAERAPGDPRAQGGRTVAGVGPAATRQGVRGVAAGGAVGSPWRGCLPPWARMY